MQLSLIIGTILFTAIGASLERYKVIESAAGWSYYGYWSNAIK